MSDHLGSRFMRMAGGQDFYSRLNRGLQPLGMESGRFDAYDFKIPEGERTGNTQMGPGAHVQQNQRDKVERHERADFAQPMETPKAETQTPEPEQSFARQVARERYLQENDIAQGQSNSTFIQRYMNMASDNISKANRDGSGIANKYIQNAARTNPVDVAAMDRNIRRTALVDRARGELEGVKTFGDMYRYSREQLPTFELPDSPSEIERPDFGGMYDKVKEDIDSYKV